MITPVRPTLIDDVEQLAGGLARRELVGDRPARVAPDHAKLALLREAIDLDDDAVGLVLELVAAGHPLAAVGDHLLEILEAPAVAVDREAERAEQLERLPLRAQRARPRTGRPHRRRSAAARPAVIDRILLAQRAGGGVARVGGHALAGGGQALVQRLEVGDAHVDFAAHLDRGGIED